MQCIIYYSYYAGTLLLTAVIVCLGVGLGLEFYGHGVGLEQPDLGLEFYGHGAGFEQPGLGLEFYGHGLGLKQPDLGLGLEI